MKLISVTQGRHVVYTMIDDIDYLELKNHKYYINERIQGVKRVYVSIGRSYNLIPLSIYIMCPPKGLVVDHINGNTLDNRRSNLRVCTQSQNLMNSKKPSNNKSGFKGISWHKSSKSWQVYITANKKRIIGGYFKCRLLASLKREELTRKHHGRFANFG